MSIASKLCCARSFAQCLDELYCIYIKCVRVGLRCKRIASQRQVIAHSDWSVVTVDLGLLAQGNLYQLLVVIILTHQYSCVTCVLMFQTSKFAPRPHLLDDPRGLDMRHLCRRLLLLPPPLLLQLPPPPQPPSPPPRVEMSVRVYSSKQAYNKVRLYSINTNVNRLQNLFSLALLLT